MASSFRLEGDLVGNLDQLEPKIKRAMVAGANLVATESVGYMRGNATWTDRTGAARSGLNTKVQVGGNKVSIVFFHSVPYGVYLEVRWGGKYAIIRPALEHAGPRLVQVIGRLMFK